METADPAVRKDLAFLLTASAACGVTVLDSNVVGVVLPTIARDLNAGFAQIEWVVSAYVLTFAALLLPAGSIADRFGRRRVLSIGVVAFALASLACGLAPNALALYAARAAQGASAALLLAPALATLGHAFREEAERARAWATWGGIMGLTMVLSPLIGGAIGALAGWRWAFLINLPLCAALLVAVRRYVGESRDLARVGLDLPGIALFSSGMFALTWALIVSAQPQARAVDVALRAGAGALLLTAFVAVERRSVRPMLDLSLFARLPFAGAVGAMFAYAAAAQVMTSLLPVFLQNGRGLSTLQAGLAMMPFAVAMLVLPQVARRISPRLGSRRMLALGLTVTALGDLALAAAAGQPSPVPVALAMMLLGSGGGLLNGETQKAIMGTIPAARSGMGSGISTTARFSGILIGFTGLGAVLASSVRVAAGHAAHPGLPADFAARVAAGDGARLPAGALRDLAERTYSQGFAAAFLAAGLLAGASAALVWWSMRPQAERLEGAAPEAMRQTA